MAGMATCNRFVFNKFALFIFVLRKSGVTLQNTTSNPYPTKIKYKMEHNIIIVQYCTWWQSLVCVSNDQHSVQQAVFRCIF